MTRLFRAGLASRTVFPNLIRRSAANVRMPSAGEPDSSPCPEPGSLFNQVREFALGVATLSEPDSPQANQIRALAPNLIRRRPALRVADNPQAEPGSRVFNRRTA